MKKYILLMVILLSFTFASCKKAEKKSFDRNNPSPIVVNVEGDVSEITVTGEGVNDKITEFEQIFKNGNVYLGSYFFSKYENGTYKITIKAQNKVTVTIEVEGTNQDYNLIRKQDIFEKNEKRYYVLFSREGCTGCEQLKPDLIIFNNFLSEYPKGTLDTLYVVNYSDPDFEASKGESTEYIGISSYDELINNVSISTPTLFVIENGAVKEYYIGATNISSYFYIEMSNIKDKIVVHNVDEPKVITVTLDFTPERYAIIKPDGTRSTYVVNEFAEGGTGFDGSSMIFAQYFFNSYMPGTYTINIFNTSGEEKEFILISKSELHYIRIEDIFDQEEDIYYVFFLRDGCSGCNAVKPTLRKYTKYYDLYDSTENYPLYAVHRSMNTRYSYIGDPEFFVGAKDYTEIKLGYYPRVVLIKNHEIVELYKNEGSQIMTHFKEVMSKLK